MKILFFVLALCFSNFIEKGSLNQDIATITTLVQAFSENADKRNVKKMDAILHKDFRAIVNQALGSKEVQLMDKNTYLDLMKKKVIGGDERVVTINSINLEGNNAIIKATFSGKTLNFTTFIQVVRNIDGKWQIMSDMPSIKKVN